jgi:hypothetical protein
LSKRAKLSESALILVETAGVVNGRDRRIVHAKELIARAHFTARWLWLLETHLSLENSRLADLYLITSIHAIYKFSNMLKKYSH